MLPKGVKSLADINDVELPEDRIRDLGTLLEYLLKSITPNTHSLTLNALVKQHQAKFSRYDELSRARWTRNAIAHCDHVTARQVFDAETRLDEAIREVLPHCSELVRTEVMGVAAYRENPNGGTRNSPLVPAKPAASMPATTPMMPPRLPITPQVPHSEPAPGSLSRQTAPAPKPLIAAPPMMPPQAPLVPKPSLPVRPIARPRPPVAEPAEVATSGPVGRVQRPPAPGTILSPRPDRPAPLKPSPEAGQPTATAHSQIESAQVPRARLIRLNELARELGVKAHEILDRLPELGCTEKKTHSSSIPEDIAVKLRRLYGTLG